QAEDGIRDPLVTGVQTCALPISTRSSGTDRLAPGSGADVAPSPRKRPWPSRGAEAGGGAASQVMMVLKIRFANEDLSTRFSQCPTGEGGRNAFWKHGDLDVRAQTSRSRKS